MQRGEAKERSGLPAPARSPGMVWRAPVFRGHPGRRLCGPSQRPHSPRTAQASRARTASLILPGLRSGVPSTDGPASGPPPCAPRPFIPRGAGQAQSLTPFVCAARLPNRPSALPLHSSLRLITSFPDLWDRFVGGIQHKNADWKGIKEKSPRC